MIELKYKSVFTGWVPLQTFTLTLTDRPGKTTRSVEWRIRRVRLKNLIYLLVSRIIFTRFICVWGILIALRRKMDLNAKRYIILLHSIIKSASFISTHASASVGRNYFIQRGNRTRDTLRSSHCANSTPVFFFKFKSCLKHVHFIQKWP